MTDNSCFIGSNAKVLYLNLRRWRSPVRIADAFQCLDPLPHISSEITIDRVHAFSAGDIVVRDL
jgi:hypothetical protein